jgi:hypothetical protein
MKVSIAWVLDHIDADYHSLNIPALITKINQTTAEIERSYPVKINLNNLSLATIQATAPAITAYSAEWDASVPLPKRDGIKKGQIYLVSKKTGEYHWATSLDLGGHKEMLLPALHLPEKELNGTWKKKFETQDYIFEVDNKSINHRPDLWGHRGFAREIAAMLDLPLKPLSTFCAKVPTIKSSKSWHLAITPKAGCNRLAGLFVPGIKSANSLLWMVSRLSRVDSKAINAIVDCTNYVMLDISQPMHAFDADKISKKSLTARRAANKEQLTLLDDQKIELTSDDIIIALQGLWGAKKLLSAMIRLLSF